MLFNNAPKGIPVPLMQTGTLKPEAKGQNFLLADPGFNTSYLIQDFLLKNKFVNKFDVVRDGIEVIDFLSNLRYRNDPLPDFLLLDLNIPYSREILTRICNDENFSEMKIIIFSHFEPAFIKINYQLPKNHYIVKPFDFKRCQQIIMEQKINITFSIDTKNLHPQKRSYAL